MFSVSYANAAAGAANESALETVKAKLASTTTTTEEVDDSSTATTEEESKEEDKSEKSSEDVKGSSSPKLATKEKAKLNLAPAPVPKVSPWLKKNASSSSSNSKNSSANDKNWPTPELSVLLEVTNNSQKAKSNPPAAVKSTGKEKWVPFQASVVMSGPKTGKGNGQNNGANLKKNNNKAKKGTRQPDQAKQGRRAAGQRQLQHSKGDQLHKSDDKAKADDAADSSLSQHAAAKAPESLDKAKKQDDTSSKTSADKTPAKDQPLTSSSSVQKSLEPGQGAQSQQQPPHSSQQHSQDSKHQFQHHHSRQYSNGGARRYNNRPQNGFVPFNRNLNFIPTTYLPNGQVFQPRSFNQGFIPHQASQHMDNFRRFSNGFPPPQNGFHDPYQNMVPISAMNPAIPPIPQVSVQDPITSLALQVDYYFSIQNLVKDIFLRKQMDSEGYIPLKVIANFYRVQHLSGGDLKLVVDALDSCGNLEYIGNKDTFELKLRPKENPLNWVLPEDQRENK